MGSIDTLEELYETIYYGLGIAELGIAGVMLMVSLIVGLVAAVVGLVVSLVVFVLEAIPLYKISKKLDRKYAWLVWLSWIPFIGGYFSTYVLSDIPGDQPVKLVSKLTVENRVMSFWIYTGIRLFGATLITVLISIVNMIPVLGQVIGAFSTLLYLAPTVAAAWIEYAYLRDVLDLFKPDQKSNNTAAIIITALDTMATLGLARAIYLYTIMNKEPLPQQVLEVQEAE